MVTTKERYRELRNAVGYVLIGYGAMVILFMLNATPEDISKFGWFMILPAAMIIFLGYKSLQTRGVIK